MPEMVLYAIEEPFLLPFSPLRNILTDDFFFFYKKWKKNSTNAIIMQKNLDNSVYNLPLRHFALSLI